MIKNKVQILHECIWKENNFDYFLITSDINRKWLTNFSSSYGFVLVSKKNPTPQIFLDDRYFAEGKKLIVNCEVKNIAVFAKLWKGLQGEVGFESDLIYSSFQQLSQLNAELKLTPFNLNNLRLIKTAVEIASLRQICQLTNKIWAKVVVFVKKVRTEKAVEKFIINQFLANDVSELSFFPIVASGKNSAFIHTKAREVNVKDNLLCDFGGKWNGYCSDFSRTIIFNSESKLNQYLPIVKKIHTQVINNIKPGIKVGDLVKISDRICQENNFKLAHALGHGIGLKVHEAPNFFLANKLVLQPGMVFTIEPGIYLSGIGGIRIEDVVLVTEKGCEILTR